MIRRVLALLLFALSAQGAGTTVTEGANDSTSAVAGVTAAASTCSPICTTADPWLPTLWSTGYASSEACPITVDTVAQTIQRTVPVDGGTLCDHDTAIARLNIDVGRDGCIIARVVSDSVAEDAIGSAFEVGFVARHQLSQMLPAPGSQTGRSYWLRCENGLGCSTLQFTTDVVVNNSSNTFANGSAIPNNGYIGMCIRNTGSLTVTKAWNFGTTDPGAPLNLDGGDGPGGTTWGAVDGTNDVTFTGAPFGGLDYDDSGNYFGLIFRSNDAGASAVLKYDNVRVYSCIGS
jgi:hypothetical protein